MSIKPKLSTREICEATKSEVPNHQLKAEVHALRAKLIKQEAEFQEFTSMFHDVASLLFPKTTISKLRKIFEGFNSTHELQITIKEGIADARTHAWTDERRAKFGASISASWAAKRENENFYVYHYKPVKGGATFMDTPYKEEMVTGYKALAEKLGIPTKVKYIKDRLWLKPDGQTFKLSVDHKVVVALNSPVAEKPLQERRDEFEQKYFKKHGIWPNEDQIPDNLIKLRPQTDKAGRAIRNF